MRVNPLSLIFRKVPLLRACYGERDGETWLREMQDEIIDFEVRSAGFLHRHCIVIVTVCTYIFRNTLSEEGFVSRCDI